jgi:excisionase family DNA binding protein
MNKTAVRSTEAEAEAAGFWTVKQVAAYLRCSTGAVWGWKREGLLRAYQVGRLVRFLRADVDRFVAQGSK